MKFMVLVLLVVAVCSVGKADEVNADKVNAFFRQFEKCFSAGDKIGLLHIVSKEQREWCFEDIDNLKRNSRVVGVKVDIESDSIVIGPQQVRASGIMYKTMKGGQRSGEVQMDFTLERRGDELILVDTKSPAIEAHNLLMENGRELAIRMQNAINNRDKAGVMQVFGENADSFKSEDLSWVSEAITNKNVLVESYRVAKSQSKITVTFTTKQSHTLDLVVETVNGVPKYSLAKPADIAPIHVNPDRMTYQQYMEEKRGKKKEVEGE